MAEEAGEAAEGPSNLFHFGVVNHGLRKISVSSNSVTIQCYSAAMTAIWQHFVLNSELRDNSDLFDTILLRYSYLEPLYHYLATLLFIYRIIEMLYGIWVLRFFHPDSNSNCVYIIKTDVIFWQEKDSYHRDTKPLTNYVCNEPNS
jgi:hypothetical protein